MAIGEPPKPPNFLSGLVLTNHSREVQLFPAGGGGVGGGSNTYGGGGGGSNTYGNQ